MKILKNIWLLILATIVVYALIVPFKKHYNDTPKTVDTSKEPSSKPIIEKPLHDIELPNFNNYRDVKDKKVAFFSFLKPAIIAENERILRLRISLKNWGKTLNFDETALAKKDVLTIESLAIKYKVNTRLSLADKVTLLLLHVDEVPTPLVLVQAANESAWGTSRFARIGLNFFGIWCYKKGCGMVPNGRDEGLKHEVAAFATIEEAVAHYMHNINTNAAYKVLRQIRQQLREQSLELSPELLAMGLLSYSERGSDYIIEIIDMLKHNEKYLLTK